MKIRIENGMTIISTGIKGDEVVNKTGQVGVTKYDNIRGAVKYRSEITIKKHKYTIGFFDTFEEAVKARKVAEIKKSEGTLLEWLNEKPHGNSSDFKLFWERQFKKCDI